MLSGRLQYRCALPTGLARSIMRSLSLQDHTIQAWTCLSDLPVVHLLVIVHALVCLLWDELRPGLRQTEPQEGLDIERRANPALIACRG